MLHASWASQAIGVAAELGLPDLLRDGPRTSDDLAAAARAHAPSLHRLLRALTTIDICRECADGAFELTDTGALLSTDHPHSLRSWVIWWTRYLWPVWGNLLYSVKTGKSARAMLLGTEGFAHLADNPASASTFNRALAEITRTVAEEIVAGIDFSLFALIVDVGGGEGELLCHILRECPRARGILFDLPHAVEGARLRMAREGLAARCECVSGDFFRSLPRNGGAYLLKSVLHDWDDNRASELLSVCRSAMSEDSVLVVIERVLPDHLRPSRQHRAVARGDLTMLVAHAARERTEAELRSLLSDAGFAIRRMVTTEGSLGVIEAVPLRIERSLA